MCAPKWAHRRPADQRSAERPTDQRPANAPAAACRAASPTMLLAWAGLTATSIAHDAGVNAWPPGDVIAVGPSNFSLCSGSFVSGPSIVLFHGLVEGEEETGLHASLQNVAAETRRRELRVRVCKAHLSADAVGSAGGRQHVDSLQWRRALSEVLSDAKADQLRALLRLPVSRILLFRRGSFADFTSGEAPPG